MSTAEKPLRTAVLHARTPLADCFAGRVMYPCEACVRRKFQSMCAMYQFEQWIDGLFNVSATKINNEA